MALRLPINSGSWSDPTIWSGSFTPALGDVVCANNFTITIDQDINIGQLTTSATTNLGDTATMTSDTIPVGYVVSTSSTRAGSAGYFAFDKNTGNFWESGTFVSVAPQWISYTFPTAIIINRYAFLAAGNTGTIPNNWLFQASNDNTNWTTLETKTSAAPSANSFYTSPVLGNSTAYKYYRIYITATTISANTVYIAEIRLYETTNTTTSGVAGGGFRVTGSQNITCTNTNSITGGNSTVITCLNPVNTTVNINCGTNNILRPTAGSSILVSGSGAVNITGNMVAENVVGTVLTINGVTPTITFTGNVLGSIGAPASIALNASTSCSLSIIGNVVAGTQNYFSHGISFTSGLLNITGNITGTSTPQGTTYAVYVNAGTINITGNITGGGGQPTNGGLLINTGTTTVNIVGTINGPIAASGLPGVSTTANCFINHTGPIIANNFGVGLSSTGTGAINILSGPFISSTYGVPPFSVFRMHYRPTSGSYFEFRDNSTNGALSPGPIAPATYLYAPSTVIAAPNQNDVRFGTVYASGSQTGQMRVPLPSQVSIGIPVDNTVGTAVLSANDIISAVWNSSVTELTASNSIGNRLKNVSTPDITANQIIGLI